MNSVLILSERPELIKLLSANLVSLEYNVSSGGFDELEIDRILQQKPDIVLFDLSLWGAEVLQLYQRIKNNAKLKQLCQASLLLISEDGLAKVPVALELDDFLLIPYKLPELNLRIKRLLWQKNKLTDQELIITGELTINPTRYEVCIKGEPVELTFKEYELLKYLATHRNRAFNREALLNIIWGYNYYGGTRTVDVHIRRIRAKIGDEEETYIKTVRGVGYIFKA